MMRFSQGRIAFVILLMILLTTGLTAAQDETITVVGSGIVTPVLETLSEAGEIEASLNVNVTGTREGFVQFCQGQADIATANRPISAEEASNCTTNAVDYLELLIAHNIVAFVTRPNAAFAQCLTLTDLNVIFPPSAAGRITAWNQVNSANENIPLTVFLPGSTSVLYSTLDQLVEGDGLRADGTVEASDAATIESVVATEGGIGIVSLPAALAAGDRVTILDLNSTEATGCVLPGPENVEQRLYSAATPLFIYANRASLGKPNLNDLLTFISSEQAAGAVELLGLSAPTSAAYALNQNVLAGTETGNPFSVQETSFEIPEGVAGTVTIAGSVNARNYIIDLHTAFSALYAQVTFDFSPRGQVDGVRRLCNGEIDMAVTASGLSPEEIQNCEANNIQTLAIDVGREAVVLVANGSTPHLSCMTTDQIAAVWRSNASEIVTTWDQVDPAFPQQPITLFAPTAGDTYTDLMLYQTVGFDDPGRSDSNINNDPLYRAAATANVEGALTYMSWQDYQRVLANNQARIQSVGIQNAGNCITPTAETITNGTYPLTRSAQLVISDNALVRAEVQSFLWYLASDENYPLLEEAGLLGVNFGSLPALRQTLQSSYIQAAVTTSQPEATPEPGAEATVEATTEATPETTPDG